MLERLSDLSETVTDIRYFPVCIIWVVYYAHHNNGTYPTDLLGFNYSVPLVYLFPNGLSQSEERQRSAFSGQLKGAPPAG